jgi:hypothetical protein
MWKLIAGFIVFAAIAMYVLSKGGDIDLTGEKHGVDSSHDAPKVEAPKKP